MAPSVCMQSEDHGQVWIQDFPWGGAPSHWGGGGTDIQCGCFLAKMYVKTKELDPVGGAHAGGAPPGFANDGVSWMGPFL